MLLLGRSFGGFAKTIVWLPSAGSGPPPWSFNPGVLGGIIEAAATTSIVMLRRAGTATWLGTGYFVDGAVPTAVVLLWYLLLLAGSVLLIRVWLGRPGFDDRHRLARYAGALAAYYSYEILIFS
ncbi:hypothetical protein [Nocardia ninae]|uniref:Uncharacterized protein n=1 Tax=Nocardia ninae NBRC 108245 TaxID=1210091 RepID=A0A511MET4_9NOCA|nr:hypothetical protein [Nocardia ninae]GEM38366.1 hypothetical protein NN4_28850 [Nocardia ninae NBRC 108245]